MQKIINKTLKVIGIDGNILMPDSELIVNDSIANLDAIRIYKSLGMIEIIPVEEKAKAPKKTKTEKVEENPEAESPAKDTAEVQEAPEVQTKPKRSRKKSS